MLRISIFVLAAGRFLLTFPYSSGGIGRDRRGISYPHRPGARVAGNLAQDGARLRPGADDLVCCSARARVLGLRTGYLAVERNERTQSKGEECVPQTSSAGEGDTLSASGNPAQTL